MVNQTNEKGKFKTTKKQTKGLSKKGALKSKLNPNRQGDEFIINEIVFATIPGYAPWPAWILNIQNDTYFVRFFGTDEMFVYNLFIDLFLHH